MRVYHGDPAKLVAPKPAPSSELLGFVASRYGLYTDAAQELGGSFNLNLLVDGDVVRVYGPWVSAERVEELQRIRRALRVRGVPIPDLRPAADGSPWCSFQDCVLEVEEYVAGEPMDSWERLDVGMRTLGRVHTLMADLTIEVPPPIANHLPQELALAATLDATGVIRGWGPTAQEKEYAEIAETLAGMLPASDLPGQPVHGDFWDTNVLFCNSDLVAVLDFDFAGVRPRIDDLALPLSYLFETGARLSEVCRLVEAYDAGCARPLSDRERRALPFAMARMALSFLQYLVLPGNAAYMQRLRREFVEKRGPACEWWLTRLRTGELGEDTFAC